MITVQLFSRRIDQPRPRRRGPLGRRVAATLVLAPVVAAVAVATPAQAAEAETTLRVSAKLLARGAAVEIDATVRCRDGSTAETGPLDGNLTVSVTQKVGKVVTGGGALVGFVCTGRAQHVRLYVSPYIANPPFKAKDAFVAADLGVRTALGYDSVSLRKTIVIGS